MLTERGNNQATRKRDTRDDSRVINPTTLTMGGIVTKRQVAVCDGDGDVIRSEVELNDVISRAHESHRRVRGDAPFQRNLIRRVRTTNCSTNGAPASNINTQHHRPPLHPTRHTPPSSSSSNNLSVDTTNNISSSNNSTPRSAAVYNASSNSTPINKDQLSLLSCINQTPIGDEKSKFQYYCPLCMRHFQETLVVPCCNNYICFQCTVEFLGSKSIEVTRLEDLMSQQSKDILKTIYCPQ